MTLPPPKDRHPALLTRICAAAILLATGNSAHGGALRISEFMAANASTLADGNGSFSDWIEIHNAGATPIDLGGWHLTDASDDLTRWRFPSATIPPGGYLVVFASGADAGSVVDPQGNLHASFRLSAAGEFLALVEPDGATIATSFEPGYPPQSEDISYGTPDGINWGFYETPTPGGPNSPGAALPNTVEISPPGAVFSGSRSVTLSSPGLPPEAIIRHTLDGSPVSESSPVYAAPITLTARTHLRARVFLAGFAPGPEADAVFVRATPDVAGFTSNLPVVVVDTDGSIPGTTSPSLVGAHALIFDTDPVEGRSALAAAPNIAGRSGLRVRGRSSAGFPKRQFKFETWGADGGERNVPLLGMGGESDWVLHGPYTDKSLIRNVLAYSTWKKLGWTSVDTRLVEVFLNEDRDPQLSYADDYAGVYVLVEGITIDDDRVDIDKPEAAGITGGYVIETGNADSQHFTTTGSRRSVAHRFKDPNLDELNAAQRQWIRDYIQRFEEALYGPGFRHPVTGQHYSELTDSASHVDYRIIREWTRNFDGGSTFSYIDRGGRLTMSPVWDFNWALGNVNYAEGGDLPGYRTDGWNRSFTANVNGWAPWWLRFEEDPDWWQALIDRWSDLRESTLADAAVDAEIESLATLLEREAAGRNFDRWKVLGTFTVISPPGWQNRTTYRSEIDYLKQWLRDRSAWIDSQFPARLVFTPAGGAVSPENPARILSPDERGTIYYTTDGSDPRLPGGGIRPSAGSLVAAGGIVQDDLVSIDSTVKALRPTGPVPGATAWTLPGFDDTGWVAGRNGVGYENSPSNYADLIGTPIGFFPGVQPTSAYLRIAFEVSEPAAFTRLTLRIKYDDGFVAYLNGREIARRNAPEPIAWNTAATAVHPPDESNFDYEEIDLASVLAAPAGEGLIAGSNILAIHGLNLGTPNSGNTGSPDSDMLILPLLVGERVSDEAGAITLNESSIVTARTLDGSTWGPPARSGFAIGHPAADGSNTILTEIQYHPAPPTEPELSSFPGITAQDLEWLEIRNISDAPIDLTGARFDEGIRYTFPAGSVLAPSGHLAIASNPGAFAVRYPDAPAPLGPFDGALDNAGEPLAFKSADGTAIAAFAYGDDWQPATDGGGPSLNLANESEPPGDYGTPTAWTTSSAIHGTPGAPNTASPGLEYLAWLAEFFTPAEIAEGTLTNPEFDLERDGLPNFAEFALGLNPRAAERNPISISVDSAPDGMLTATLVFTRPRDLAGVAFSLEFSTNLSDWTSDSEADWSSTDLGNGTERVTVVSSHTVPPPPMPRPGTVFLRLRVSSR